MKLPWIPRVFLLAATALWCGPALAQKVSDVVDKVSQAQYRDVLDNKLFTHLGNNRGNGAQHDLARTNIADAFQSYGLQTTLEPFQFQGTTYYNVVAFKPGTTKSNQFYVVGAHFDSVNNPGADDNASGTAGVMEAARVMAPATFEASVYFIAFDREEQGLIGSYAWVQQNQTKDFRGMVSMDMVAYNPGGANKASIFGRSSSAGVKNALASAVTTYGNGITPNIGGDLPYSDHASFEAFGFGAALLIEDNYSNNPNYHRSTDSVDTPNYIDYTYATNMTRSTVGYLSTAAGLVAVPEPSTWLVALCVGASLVARRRRG